MHHIRRAGVSIGSRWTSVPKSCNGSSTIMERELTKCQFSSKTMGRTATSDFDKRVPLGMNSAGGRSSNADDCVAKEVLRAAGPLALFEKQHGINNQARFRSPSGLDGFHGANMQVRWFSRTFASRASEKEGRQSSESRKDVSTVEEPFDAPTYNIPEKPVSFTEGASYSLIILAGLGVAAAAGYAVFKELVFQPKEYKVFNKALQRIQDDSQVRARIGSPIKGFGQDTQNRAARQRIPNKIWTDEVGVEHVEVNFHIRGPHGGGKVFAEMFKDKESNEWKYTYLIVQLSSPSRVQLMLESYVPA